MEKMEKSKYARFEQDGSQQQMFVDKMIDEVNSLQDAVDGITPGTKLYRHYIKYEIPNTHYMMELYTMSPEAKPFTIADMPGISNVLKGEHDYITPLISNIMLPCKDGTYEFNYRIIKDLGPKIPHYQFYYVKDNIETIITSIVDTVTEL